MPVLTPEIRTFARPGLVGAIAVTDATRRVHTARIWAFRSLPGVDVVEVYVSRTSSQPLLTTLGTHNRAAINIIEIATYLSRAFKGSCEIHPGEIDQAFLAEYEAAMNVMVSAVGLGPSPVGRIQSFLGGGREMVSLRMQVESVFDQSPKPGAGARL